MKKVSCVLLWSLVLCACGSSTVKTVQSDKNVQQTELKIEQQVRTCMPTSAGAPDPLLLSHGGARAKFASCAGVVKNARAFDRCAFKVILGGIPTVARVEKGLTACVEKAA